MKFLSLIFLICLVASCSSTKKVVKDTEAPAPKPISKTEQIDSVTTRTTEVIKMTDSLYGPDAEEEIKIIDKPIIKNQGEETINQKVKDSIPIKDEQFHQELTKRTGDVHELWDELLNDYVSDDGNVNYKLLKKDYKRLLDYIYVLDLMKRHEAFQTLPKEEILAYWINAYNAMTIDLILRHYPIKSIKDIKDPWKQRHWQLGGKYYNLDEIEHDILRKMDEPRIHFAIVCASYSCPKLQNKAFTASNLEAQLTNATKEFLSDPERNIISKDELELSKIFQWFTKDFKHNGSLIDFLNRYSEVEISKNAKKRFKDYSWDLNE